MLCLTPDTCITWHMHDYYIITRHLVLLYFLYSCTPVSPVLILLLIAQSFRRPAEHAWCRDDENVSHDRASVWRILNETKCHTEQSATPHTWWGHLLNLWGPPLESIPHTEQSAIQSKVSHHTRGGATSWICGATSWICGATSWINPQSKVPHHTRGGGHLLNLWGLPLEYVGLLPPFCLCRLVLAW